MKSAAVLNVLVALIFALTIVVFFLLYFGPYRNPGWLSPGFAGALCLFGIAAFSTGEFIREAVRKPFVVYNVVLGNQILPPQEVLKFRDAGYLESGRWTRAYVAEHYPQTIVDGQIQGDELLKLPQKDRVALGQVLFHTTATTVTRRPKAIRPWDRCCADDRRHWCIPRSSTWKPSTSCRPGAARRKKLI